MFIAAAASMAFTVPQAPSSQERVSKEMEMDEGRERIGGDIRRQKSTTFDIDVCRSERLELQRYE